MVLWRTTFSCYKRFDLELFQSKHIVLEPYLMAITCTIGTFSIGYRNFETYHVLRVSKTFFITFLKHVLSYF